MPTHPWTVDMLKDSWPSCAVAHERFERVEVVGPMADCKRVMEEAFEAGFRITSSGPYTDREMFPQCDPERFRFVAERARS